MLACCAAVQSSAAAVAVRVEHWTQTDGLPSSAVQAAVTDQNGFLWVATSQGLARFDGRDWRVFDSRNTPALGSNEVRNLHLRRDGALVVAMASGRLLEYRPHDFRMLANLGMPAGYIVEDASARLLVAGSALVRINSRGAVERLLERTRNVELFTPLSVAGDFFALSRSGDIYALSDGKSTPTPGWHIDNPHPDTMTVWSEGGVAWLLSQHSRWRFDPKLASIERFDIPLDFLPNMATRGPDGWIWIAGHGDQVSVCRTPNLDPQTPCEPVSGIDGRNITHMRADDTGALWISSWDAGLFRVTAPPIRLFGATAGVRGTVRALAADRDDGVFVGARNAIYRIQGGTVDELPWASLTGATDGLLSLAQMPDGRLLRGRRFGVDIASPPEYRDWTSMTDALESVPAAYALHVDRAGNLWMGDQRTLRYSNNRWSKIDEQSQLVYAFAEGVDGSFWAAGGGAFRWQPNRGLVDAGAPRQSAQFILMSVMTDSRGHVWFGGYESGLYRYDGKNWLQLTTARGLPDDTGYGLVEDAQERLWVSHGRGLYTLALDEADRLALDPSARAQVREYTSADGLSVTGFNGGSGMAAVKDSAGLLWFVSDEGAVQVDSARLPQPLGPPHVVIDSLAIDGDPIPPDTHVKLQAGVQSISLEVRAPAPGYAERIGLRYRLDPMEPNWQGVPRSGLIEYQRLPPRSYQLKVQSAVDGLDWTDALDVAIEQMPYWWQRPVSWGFGLMVLAIIGFGGMRWRLSALRERNRKLESLVAERGEDLALERLAVVRAQGAQEEAERELQWIKRHRALEEWADVDATARAVYAALAGINGPAGMDALVERLSAGKPGDARPWSQGEVEAALDRLRARSAVECDSKGCYRAIKPDWALVPDLDLPLAELITRAAPRIGAYRLHERIGEGAMGEVFRAVSVHDGTEAAVKLVHRDASTNPETQRRLQREGEIVSSLSHPSIVRLLERGEHDGRLYLAMEFLVGKTLQERLGEPTPLTQVEAVDILRDIASALAALHEKGVIHRDLHPGNVMLVAGEPTRLLDFGLARATTSRTVTRANTLMGSLPYLAPEVLAGQPASAASDLFALGAIACECLSGKRIWRATQTLELLVEIARFEGPDASVLSGVPMALTAWVKTLLDLDPEKRGSASKVLDELCAAIAT